MIKRQFINKVSALARLPAEQVRAVFDAAQMVVADELVVSGDVRIPGLVSLRVMRRSERPARNPKTGDPCIVAAGHTVKSRPVSALSTIVANKLSASPV